MKGKKKVKEYGFEDGFKRCVQIEWVDSQMTYGWKCASDNDLPAKIKTVGFLVSDMKNCVTVSTSLSDSMNFTDKLTIPKVAIKRIRHFSLKD